MHHVETLEGDGTDNISESRQMSAGYDDDISMRF